MIVEFFYFNLTKRETTPGSNPFTLIILMFPVSAINTKINNILFLFIAISPF